MSVARRTLSRVDRHSQVACVGLRTSYERSADFPGASPTHGRVAWQSDRFETNIPSLVSRHLDGESVSFPEAEVPQDAVRTRDAPSSQVTTAAARF